MEFRTKLVISRSNKRAWLAYAGLFITATSLVLVFIPSLSYYIPYVFGTGIATVIIGAVVARGDVRRYGLSEEDLVVSASEISIGPVIYPMRLVSKIDFNVEAYNGLYMNDGAMIAGSSSDGMTNSLSFQSGGARVECGFYLANKEQVQQLAVLFNEFYERHMPFIERNRSTRTYMFKVLTERELVEFKSRYGYK
jgi:hypothetical protein